MKFQIGEKVIIKPSEHSPLMFHGFEGIVKTFNSQYNEYLVEVGGSIYIKIDEENLEKFLNKK